MRIMGMWVTKRWWEQEGLYMVGARDAETAVEEEGGEEDPEGEAA